MAGPLKFTSVPTSVVLANWYVSDVTRIDEGETSGAGDGVDIIADDGDEGVTQAYNHAQPPAYAYADQIKWYVRTGGELFTFVTGNVYVDGAWQTTVTFSSSSTNYTQTLSGAFTDFSTFQVKFTASDVIDKNEQCEIDYSTIEVYGYGTTNLKGGNLKGGNVGGG